MVEATANGLDSTRPLAAFSAVVVGVMVQFAIYFAGDGLWPDPSTPQSIADAWSLGGLQTLAAGLDRWALALTVAAALLLMRAKLNVLWVLALSALAGLLLAP